MRIEELLDLLVCRAVTGAVIAPAMGDSYVMNVQSECVSQEREIVEALLEKHPSSVQGQNEAPIVSDIVRYLSERPRLLRWHRYRGCELLGIRCHPIHLH